VLSLRDGLTDLYHRRAGVKTIRYHLQQLQPPAGELLRKSTYTIRKILREAGRIQTPLVYHSHPLPHPEPMTEWEFDFGLVSRGNESWLEFFLAVDRGTSIWVDTRASERFHADSALLTIAEMLLMQGMPRRLRFDRDTRLVGSLATDGYPLALVRFLRCLGIEPDICPPRRPDLKPFVERAIRTMKHECLYVHRPSDVPTMEEVMVAQHHFYNTQRPNQSLSCGNRPPYEAFPTLPSLPAVPQTVDPDAWLQDYHGRIFRRRVSATGVVVDNYSYYIGQAYARQPVALHLNAVEQVFKVTHVGKVVKQLPLQGLHHHIMAFQDYLKLMLEEARSIERYLLLKGHAVKAE
jgi:integrase-like protein